jgi:D-alanine-D-alanine ligase
VADVVADREAALASRSFDADKPTQEDILRIGGWLEQAGYSVSVISSVAAFLTGPPGARCGDMIVLPLWRGGASRNRTAIVPSICEELRLPYVGGDAFVQCVCQDKSLSKVFAQRAGFRVPGEWLLPARDDLHRFVPSDRLGGPVVVKPQYSAASIGIDEASLCWTDEAAREKADQLFAEGLGPVLCEEFLSGEEVSLCLIEEKGTLVATCAAMWVDAAGAYPYRERLFTFDEKAAEDDGCELALWPGQLDPQLWKCAADLVHLLSKVDCMRIDGRFDNGHFTVVELTQDPHLGENSELVGGFKCKGLQPPEVLDCLIQASLRNQAI